MSKKTLITFLFITIAIIALANNVTINNEANCYEYSLVNTTKEENLKETSDKVENNNYNSNVQQEQRNYNNTTSRSNELERTVVQENTSTTLEYNENTYTFKNEEI